MAKRIYITEEQFRTIVKEMAYPSNFNMEELVSLPSYEARVKYCQQRLQKIGAGSSRIVFAVDDEKVLKVAKNKKGIAQNLEEGEPWKQNYYCFANVYDQSDDGIFLEMQAARRAKPSDFIHHYKGIFISKLFVQMFTLHNHVFYQFRIHPKEFR